MILAKQKSEEAKEKGDVEQDLFSDMAPTIKRWPSNCGQYLVSLSDVIVLVLVLDVLVLVLDVIVQAKEDIYW